MSTALSPETLEAIRSKIAGSNAGPWAPDYKLAKECGGRTTGLVLLDHITVIELELAEARKKLGNSNASWATGLKERDTLRRELKNFLAAFDHYIGCSVTPSFTLSEIADAKQAMFSAANQARKVLE